MANIFTDLNEVEPKTIFKGETAVWKRTDISANYPTASYTLTWSARLESNGSTTFSATVTESGDDYIFTVDNSASVNLTLGDYVWALKITQDSDSETIIYQTGKITVADNYFADTGDTRSHAKIMLDKIESLLEGKADNDVASYSIQGRSLAKLSPQELIDWRSYYKAEYNKEIQRENIKRGEGSGKMIKVKF
jgi:hypothetical protein